MLLLLLAVLATFVLVLLVLFEEVVTKGGECCLFVGVLKFEEGLLVDLASL